MSFLTGIPELDVFSLEAICNTNKYAVSLCQNDSLWAIKVEKRFGKDVARLKPTSIEFQTQFKTLLEITPSNAAKLSVF
jgi:hypothetical protein